MPPQVYLLTTLAEILQGQVNTPVQRKQVETLSKGLFGQMVINPRRVPGEDPEGRAILTYEGDETRGGSKGRLHRALVRFGKGGVSHSVNYRAVPGGDFGPCYYQITSEIELQRNFDIFTEIEPRVFAISSKL